MTYKTTVIDAGAKTKKLAAAIERQANELAREGWALETFSVTGSGKAILVYRTETPQEETLLEAAVQEETDQTAILEETVEPAGGEV